MTPAEAVPLLAEYGIHAAIEGEDLLISTGDGSGGLVCLAIRGAGRWADLLDSCHALANLAAKTPAYFQSPDGIQQIFFRCSVSERSRTLVDGVSMHGQGDAVKCFPTLGWTHISGTLTDLPTIPWADYCVLVEELREDFPAPAPLPSLTDGNLELMYQTMSPTEDSVAMVFEERYKDELRYCDTWGRWLKWDECRWGSEHTLLAFDYCRTLARKVNMMHGKSGPSKSSFASGVERFARASRVFATRSDEWDRNHWLLNTPTATMDLKAGAIKTHDRTDYLTKCARVKPAEGKHPVFDLFLQEITLGDEALVNYHQRALGACLSGAIQDNFLLFWYGTGQNGKNTFGDLIEWILGDYAKVIPAETLMADKGGPRHPTDLANLRGVRLAISSEVEEGCYFNEQRIKSLTGDATISARFIRQDFFEFARTHKHLVYGNHRPMLRAVDPAIRTRLHIVPFKAFFPHDRRDPQMAAKLRAEAPQIMQWLIDGHEQWIEAGYLKPCAAVQAETDSYFESQSTPDMWLGECCTMEEMARTSARELYGSFKTWKEGRGEGVMSQTRWGEWMSTRFDKIHLGGRIHYRGVDVRAQSIFDSAPT